MADRVVVWTQVNLEQAAGCCVSELRGSLLIFRGTCEVLHVHDLVHKEITLLELTQSSPHGTSVFDVIP